MPRFDVSSMHGARIAFDVVQRSQYVQDLHDLCLLNQCVNRILFVFCLNPPKYQFIVDNRMKIERTSDVRDVMEYSTLNHYIVL